MPHSPLKPSDSFSTLCALLSRFILGFLLIYAYIRRILPWVAASIILSDPIGSTLDHILSLGVVFLFIVASLPGIGCFVIVMLNVTLYPDHR